MLIFEPNLNKLIIIMMMITIIIMDKCPLK